MTYNNGGSNMEQTNPTDHTVSRARLVVITLAGLAVLALIALISYAPWDSDTVADERAARAVIATIAAVVLL